MGKTQAVTLHLGDCLDVMRGMPDASVDAVVTDPPYFKVKDDGWDRQWKQRGDFLAWLGTVADEWRRVLKGNGSVFCFASPQMAARVECLLAERFNVLNHLVWVKREPGGHEHSAHNRMDAQTRRRYAATSERIIFAEQFGADQGALGLSTYAAKCNELRGFVFEPLRAYLAAEVERAGWTPSMVLDRWRLIRGGGASMPGHWFARSQWQLPTAKNYEWLRQLLNGEGGEYLRREYEELRREYEELRRPFSVTADVPWSDVWEFAPVMPYAGKHPCEKPLPLMRHMIATTTRPGAVVLDCFLGSGSTGVACVELGRSFVGIEREPEYLEIARARIAAAQGGCSVEPVRPADERGTEEPACDLFGWQEASG